MYDRRRLGEKVRGGEFSREMKSKRQEARGVDPSKYSVTPLKRKLARAGRIERFDGGCLGVFPVRVRLRGLESKEKCFARLARNVTHAYTSSLIHGGSGFGIRMRIMSCGRGFKNLHAGQHGEGERLLPREKCTRNE